MAINGSIVNEEGDSLLISLLTPYTNLKSIISFQDETIGEDDVSFFYKEFRWSINGVTYSDYIELTNENLQNIELVEGLDFWIQYRYTAAELYTGNTLEFISISLEVETFDGTIKAVPQIECCNSDSSNSCENLIIDCCGDNLFNPYNLNKAIGNYNQLSQVVSDIFGHCVTYFKTDPKKESRDVILKEYSLYDVIKKSDIKILVPDNQLPSAEIQYTMMDMDLPDLFEIHIVKTEFQRVFGKAERPSQFDYLWFPLTDRMYEVNSITNADDFMNESSYYRVNLVLYKDRKNRDYSENPDIEDELSKLMDSADKLFGEEANDEMEKVRNPKQYNETGLNSKDPLRAYLNPALIIERERLISNYTIISKHNYNLQTIQYNSLAVTYKYNQFLKNNSSFLFLAKTKFNGINTENIQLVNITYNSENFTVFETSTAHKYKVGEYVRIRGTQSYNNIHKIIEVSDNTFTVDMAYINSIMPNGKSNKEEFANIIQYINNNYTYNIIITLNYIIIENGISRYVFNLIENSSSLQNNEWYGFVINVSQNFKQLSLFVYKLSEKSGYNPQKDAEFIHVYNKTIILNNFNSIEDGGKWNLIGTDANITNIRIFRESIEEENHNIMLSQYVVKDSHLALLIDNAIPEIRSMTKNNPR